MQTRKESVCIDDKEVVCGLCVCVQRLKSSLYGGAAADKVGK